jgi:alpha-tubulin suppressor-like RCC1 family protein
MKITTQNISNLRVIAVFGGALTLLTTPAFAATPRKAVQIDAGYAHTCAVTSCGEVKCWGRNDWGQSLDMYPSKRASFFYQAPFTEVSVGQYHSCALDEDQNVVCWGKGNYGQSSEPTGNFVAVDSGDNHACALDTSGRAVCWGADDQDQASPPVGDYKAISAGRSHSCAVTSNGQEVQCWGSNSHGQGRSVASWDLATGELFRDVSAGSYHTCGLTETRRVVCWGTDVYGAVSGGGAAFDQGGGIFRHPYNAWRGVSAGTLGTLGLNQDGPNTTYNEAWGWGWPFSSSTYAPPTHPSSAPVAVAAGYNHGCTIDHNGHVDCFGSNSYGKASPDPMVGNCGPFVLEPFEFELF